MEHNNHSQPHTTAGNVLAKIRARNISMRPKAFFVLQILGIIALSAIALVLSIFIITVIVFSFRVGGHTALFGFGFRGVLAFLSVFPWGMLAFDMLAILALAKLLRSFGPGYRTPVVYMLGAIILFSLGAAFALDRGTMFNDQLRLRASRHELPSPLENVYREHSLIPAPEQGVCRCIIMSVTATSMTVRDMSLGDRQFVVPLEDDPVLRSERLEPGDDIMIVGDMRGGNFIPAGMHHLKPKKHIQIKPPK